MDKPRELFDAVGELALAIKPHNMDRDQRERIKTALHVLVDHIIAVGEARTALAGGDILAQADENSALKARVVQLEKALLCYACECGPDQIAICRRLDRDDCGWAAKECFGGTREGVRAARSAALAGGDHD